MYCCEKCFDENEIIDFIKISNVTGNCDYCGNENINIIDLITIGKFIREGFSRSYDHVEDFTGAMWDSEDKCYIGATGSETGESLFEILYYSHQIFSDQHTDKSAELLLQDIMNESGLSYDEKKDGCTDYLDDIYSPQFVYMNSLYGKEAISEHIAWEKFKYSCKYFNRYFDLSDDSDRESLLNSLKTVFSFMEDYINLDTRLFRVRSYKLKEKKCLSDIDHYREIAPAPKNYSTNNRMSPAGISYTYLATDIDTCIKETRLMSDDFFIGGEFQVRRNLRILDLSVAPLIPRISIFSDRYNHDWSWIREFLDDFTAEISKPISDSEKDLEYIATQVLSEYIRKLGYEGIKFESSLVKGSYNIVLFCGPNPELCRDIYGYQFQDYMIDELEYFTNWLELKSISYMQISVDHSNYKIIDHCSNIHNTLKEPLFPSSIRDFYRIDEIKEEICELEKLPLKNYDLYINNNSVDSLSINSIFSDFVNSKIHNRIKFWLSTQKGFHCINITVGCNYNGLREMIEISLIDKNAKDKWDSLLSI